MPAPDTPDTGGKPLGGQASRRSQPDKPYQGVSQDVGGKPGGGENFGPRSPALPGHPQQQMFRAHIAVSQLGGALLGKTQGGLRPGSEFNSAYDPVSSFRDKAP